MDQMSNGKILMNPKMLLLGSFRSPLSQRADVPLCSLQYINENFIVMERAAVKIQQSSSFFIMSSASMRNCNYAESMGWLQGHLQLNNGEAVQSSTRCNVLLHAQLFGLSCVVMVNSTITFLHARSRLLGHFVQEKNLMFSSFPGQNHGFYGIELQPSVLHWLLIVSTPFISRRETLH